ncbi:MAG: O-antigen ligase family protein [Candidatus Brocadiaceae bacterium]|nr:O-antigen ligase family protein [Candidatus Brocadiaceae bacterium]
MSYHKISNKIIEWGIIFLIVLTPIAYGAVQPWAYTLMELTIIFLVIIWIIRVAMINLNNTKSIRRRRSRSGNLPEPAGAGPALARTDRGGLSTCPNRRGRVVNRNSLNRFGFIKTPLNIPIILFIALILFQLVPFPPGVLKIISPNTYQLYKTTLPGWPDKVEQSDRISESSIVNLPEPEGAGHKSPNPSIPELSVSIPESLNSSIPQLARTDRGGSSSWKTISIYNHATKTELYKMLAYIGMFMLIVNYNPSTRSRQPVTTEHREKIKKFITRLIIVMAAVGCFESVYGLLECMSGHDYVLYMKKGHAGLGFVSGTYINRNHFAGYMAIAICMSFGYLAYILSGNIKTNVSGWRQKLSRIINMVGTKSGLLFFALLIMSTSLILSGSRMGICSFITSVILMSLVVSKKISIKKTSIILIPVCLIALWIGLNPVIERFSKISNHMESEGARLYQWKDTYNLIKDFPISGTGLGTYEYSFAKYKANKHQRVYDHTHNDYLELIANAGLAGFIIIMAGGSWYLFAVTRLLYRRQDPFVRYVSIGCLGGITYIILHSLTDFNLQVPANALYLSMITGIMHKTVTQV